MQERLTLGRTLNFATTVADYPASDGWTLKIALIPRAGGSVVTLTSAADGDDHRFQVTAATTGAWTAGTYNWASWVEKAGEKYDVSQGVTDLLANPESATTGYDIRTQAQKALDDARAALAAWTPTTKRYAINGREMEFSSQADIIALVSYWESEVAREENSARMAKGLATNRQVFVRLGRA